MRAWAFPITVLGALLVVGLGCRADPPAALLDVVTFAPSQADLGDRLEVLHGIPPRRAGDDLVALGHHHSPTRPAQTADVNVPDAMS